MAYPGTIGPGGLSIPSLQDIIDYLEAGMLAIYPSANLNPNSPDGQWIALVAQATLDSYQLLAGTYTSFDPSQATGTNLDRDCAYNGVTRNAGTYTQQNVAVTTSGAVTLPGLDHSAFPFTVADAQGNQYQLITTTAIPSSGTTSLLFEAALIGPIQSAPNTITVPVTILPSVTSVNNPTGPSSVGINEEADPSLRIRRANSVALPSKGYLQGLYGALLDIEGVAYAAVYENTGSSTDIYGTPGHSIWCVVDINGSSVGTIENEVANAIYIKRNAGCGLRGNISIPITQVDGSTFNVLFDTSVAENLWVKATVVPITGAVDANYIASQVLAQFANSYSIGESADSSSIVAYIKQIAPNAAVSLEGVSTNGSSWGTLITPTGINYQFEITGSSYVQIST